MPVPRRGFLWKVLQSWWILLLFTIIGNWIAFLYIGLRVRNWRWVGWSVVYSYPLIMALIDPPMNTELSVVFALSLLAAVFGSMFHGFAVCGKYLRLLEERQAAAWETYLRSTGGIPGGIRNETQPWSAYPDPQATGTVRPDAPESAGQWAAADQRAVRWQTATGGPLPAHGRTVFPEQPLAFGQAAFSGQTAVPGQPPGFGQAAAAGGPAAPDSAPPMAPPPIPPGSGAKVVDVNSAPESEIAALPGVGAILAKKACQHRESNGGFRSVDEFFHVLGLKPHAIERIRPLVTVGSPSPDSPPPFSPPSGGRVVDY